VSRAPRLAPHELSGAESELYTLFTTGTRARPGSDFSLVDASGQLIGPPASWMMSAELGLALERVGREIRFNLALPARSREIVILMVAEAEDSDFERYAHKRAATRAGLSAEEIDSLSRSQFVPHNAHESVLIEMAQVLIAGDSLSDHLWERAVAEFSLRGSFEIVTLIGYYRLIALQLRAFDILPPM